MKALQLFGKILAVGALLGAPALVRAQTTERVYECRQLAGPEEYGRGFSGVGSPSIDSLGRVVFAGMKDDFGIDLARCCDGGVPLQVFARQVSCPAGPGVELFSIQDPEANALGQVLYRAHGCDGVRGLFLSQNQPASLPQLVVDETLIQIQDGQQPALGGSHAYYLGFDPVGPSGLFRTGFGGGGLGTLLLPGAVFDVAASGVTGDWAAITSGALGGTELVVNGGPPPFAGLGEFSVGVLSLEHTFAYPRVAYVTVDPDDLAWQIEVSGTPYVTSDVDPFSFGGSGLVLGLAVNGGGELAFVYDTQAWWADGASVERLRCRNWYDSPAFELGRPLLGRRGLDGRGRIALIARSPLDDEWVVRLDPIEFGNRLENGGFSDGGQLRGWGDDFDDLDPVGAEWSSLDESDDPDSGSLRLLDTGMGDGDAGGASARQCVPFEPGSFSLGVSTFLPAAENGDGEASATWTWLAGDDCGGESLGSTTLFAPAPRDAWQRVETAGSAPAGTRSALVTLAAVHGGGAAFAAHFDEVLLVPEPGPLAGLAAAAALLWLRRRSSLVK